MSRSFRPLLLSLLLLAALPAGALAKGGPDLSVTSVVVTAPQIVKGGDALSVTDAVKSAGAGASGSTVAYYLSLDAKKSPGDVRLTGARRLGALKPNGVFKGKKLRLKIPASVRVGAYTLLACADDAGKVKEGNERNNCKAAKGRIVVTGRPKPVTVAPQPNEAAAGGGDVPRSGGDVSATGADGTRYTLTIPDGALLDPASVRIVPLSSVGGLPLPGGLVGAVQLQPAGTKLYKAATLTVTPAKPLDAARATAFGFQPNGSEFHLTPVSVAGGSASLKVFELKGFGVGLATARERWTLSRTRLPTNALDALQHIVAAPTPPGAVKARVSQGGQNPEYVAAVQAQVLTGYLLVKSLTLSAPLETALLQYVIWDSISLTTAGFVPEYLTYRELLKNDFRIRMIKDIAEAQTFCSTGDVRQVARLVRLRRFAVETLGQLQLTDVIGRAEQAMDRCLRFELAYDVSISGTNGYNEAVQASVKSTVRLRMTAPGNTSSFTGDAPLEVTNYSVGPEGCWAHTWNVNPAAPIVVSPMKLDVAEQPGLETFPPTIEVSFQPGSLDEKVTHICDGDPDSAINDQQHAYDGVLASLLGGEAGQSFTLRWTGEPSGGSYSKQSFTRSSSDGGSYTGTITFELRHTPG